MAPKVHCFAGFCHHRLVITSAHTHAYRYPLFKSGMKTGLWTIALCRKGIVPLHDNGKVETIIDILQAMVSRLPYSAKFWRDKTLANRSFYEFLRGKCWRIYNTTLVNLEFGWEKYWRMAFVLPNSPKFSPPKFYAIRYWYIVACGSPINGTGFGNWFAQNIWEITSSFCFAGIIHHCIVLRYLLAVLRLSCAL